MVLAPNFFNLLKMAASGSCYDRKSAFMLGISGDSWGITKYHSNQYVRCWKQWRTDELVDVSCPLGAYEKVFWWSLDLNQFASN